MSSLRLLFFGGPFFFLLVEHLEEVSSGGRFHSESSARLLWEGSLPVPQRIAHILLCYS